MDTKVPFRHARIGTLGLVLLGVALLTLVVSVRVLVHYAFAEPVITINYLSQIDEIGLKRQPEGENAWPIYESIITDLQRQFVPETDRRFSDAHTYITWVHDGDWGDPRHDDLRALLRAAAPTLDRIDAAIEAPGFFRSIAAGREEIEPTPVIRTLMPHMMDMQNVAQLNIGAVRDAVHGAEWEDVVRLARNGLIMGRHLSLQPSYIEALMAIRLQEMILRELHYLACEGALPNVVCEKLVAVIDRESLHSSDLMGWIDVEMVYLYDALQWCYTDDGAGDGKLIYWMLEEAFFDNDPAAYTPLVMDRLGNLRALFAPSRSETMADITRYERQLRLAVTETLRGNFQSGPIATPDLMRNVFLGQLTPAHERAVHNVIRHNRDVAATRLTLRLAAFRARHGDWPATLAEAADLEETLDPLSGLPFEYTLTPDDEDGLPFTLNAPHMGIVHFDHRREMIEPRLPFFDP